MERAKQQQLQPHISQGSPASSGSSEVLGNEANPYDVTGRSSAINSSETDPKGVNEAVSPETVQNVKEDQQNEMNISEIEINLPCKDQTSLMKVGLESSSSGSMRKLLKVKILNTKFFTVFNHAPHDPSITPKVVVWWHHWISWHEI